MYEKELNKSHINQGDIFQNFDYIRWAETKGDYVDLDVIEIPFFVVLTQSCDLEQDFNDRKKTQTEKMDKIIQSILVCPAYQAELVRNGIHLQGLGLKMENYGSDKWHDIKSNHNTRYHYLEQNEDLSLPGLVIDFKQYYTIPTQVLYKCYKNHYVGSLKPLFRENVSHRFAFYLSRIGLPKQGEKDNVDVEQS